MNEIYKRIEALCENKHINITTMCKEAGVNRGNLSDLKMGRQKGLSASNIQKIATYFDVPTSYILGWQREPDSLDAAVIDHFPGYDPTIETISQYLERTKKKAPAENGERQISVVNLIPVPQLRKVPLLGTIACGEPILAVENIEDEVDMPSHISADFALRCKGDSMINARIFDGDIVYIRQQDIVDNNDIAAVLIGEEATLKRVRLFEDHIALEPENPKYRPFVYWNEEMNDVRILGKAVAFTSTVR